MWNIKHIYLNLSVNILKTLFLRYEMTSDFNVFDLEIGQVSIIFDIIKPELGFERIFTLN